MKQMKKAHLILEDGSVFDGFSFGFDKDVDGEVVFNTGMMGYPETLTDPSYRGQILVSTYPLQGNYGVPKFNEFDNNNIRKNFESDQIHVRAFIVSEYSTNYNHWEAYMSLSDFLKRQQIPGITGIDTRALTKKLREHGVMLGKIVIGDKYELDCKHIQDPNKLNLVGEVSCKIVQEYGKGKKTVLLVDVGAKLNIIRSLLDMKVKVIRVPYDYPFMNGSLKFDGILISNGPGDPASNKTTINEIKKAIDKDIKIFGICLGNQLLALAGGAKTFKLKYGHRSQNQPCEDLQSGKCVITSQNHGYAVDTKSLPKNIQAWFKNVNDNTNEGILFNDKPVRSVQFHPEHAPGPMDSEYLFEDFVGSL